MEKSFGKANINKIQHNIYPQTIEKHKYGAINNQINTNKLIGCLSFARQKSYKLCQSNKPKPWELFIDFSQII